MFGIFNLALQKQPYQNIFHTKKDSEQGYNSKLYLSKRLQVWARSPYPQSGRPRLGELRVDLFKTERTPPFKTERSRLVNFRPHFVCRLSSPNFTQNTCCECCRHAGNTAMSAGTPQDGYTARPDLSSGSAWFIPTLGAGTRAWGGTRSLYTIPI